MRSLLTKKWHFLCNHDSLDVEGMSFLYTHNKRVRGCVVVRASAFGLFIAVLRLRVRVLYQLDLTDWIT